MSKIVVLFVALTIYLVTALPVKAQFSDSSPSLKTVLSNKPFFNTPSVLTLTGDYVNSPREDFLQSGSYNLPLALDQMDGLVAGVAFGDNAERGQWQLAYSRKLMIMDSSWEAIAEASAGLTLSDRRSQVLKASYSIRNWWRLGVSTFLEDRYGDDPGYATVPLIPGSGQSFGFQVDTTFKF